MRQTFGIVASQGSGIRYGTGDETKTGASTAWDLDATVPNAGMQFTTTAAGTIVSGEINIDTVNGAGDIHFELWTDSPGNPGSQVGTDSDSVAMATGVVTASFPTPPSVSDATKYWLVVVRESGDSTLSSCADTSILTGLHGTITSISDGINVDASEDLMITAVAA